MTLRQREPRIHDGRHLAFVRLQPCCICKKPGPSEAAHIRMNCAALGKVTGLGEKPHDMYTTPLCAYHHRTGAVAEHKLTEKVFWPMFGRNPFEIAARLWIESSGASRALEPKAVKKARKTKPRERAAPTRQIHGRPLQSKSTWPAGRKLQSHNSFEKRP